MLLSQAIPWPLSFITPVLVVALYEMPINQPPLAEFGKNLLATTISVTAVFIFVMLLQPFPLVFICAYSLLVFWLAYLMHKGAPLVPMLLSLIAAIILPIVGMVDEGLSAIIGGCLLLSMLLGQVIVQLGFGLLPDPPTEEAPAVAAYQTGYHAQFVRASLATTLAMVPAMVFFLAFNIPAQLVVMMYITIIVWEGNLGHSIYDAKKYLMANLVGGLTALIVYYLLVAVPEIYFLIPVMLLVTVLFANYRFSGRAGSAFFGSALIGVVILISSSTGASADIDTNIVVRVFYIFLASAYGLCAMSIIAPLVNPDGEAAGH
jgi:hypothetical protein